MYLYFKDSRWIRKDLAYRKYRKNLVVVTLLPYRLLLIKSSISNYPRQPLGKLIRLGITKVDIHCFIKLCRSVVIIAQNLI